MSKKVEQDNLKGAECKQGGKLCDAVLLYVDYKELRTLIVVVSRIYSGNFFFF